MIKVFVYGTLRGDTCASMVIGRLPERLEATLEGYRKEGLNIIKDPDSEVPGDILEVTMAEMKRLDQYEGLGSLYHKITVNINGENILAYQLIAE